MLLTGTVRADRPLLVVALAQEAAHLDGRLPVLLTGVGKVSTAIAVTRVLASGARPREIINLGTAGALRTGLSGTHEIGHVIQHDYDSAMIEQVTGAGGGGPLTLHDDPDALVLATGDVFVSDPAVRADLAWRAHLVDMEGYAVASAAHAFDTSVRIVKHVSDEADAAAEKGWASTVDECARALAKWLAGI